MEPAELGAFEARLVRMERRLRVTTTGWAITLIVIAVLGLFSSRASSQSESVRARALEVIDAAGVVRVALSVQPEGIAEIALSDAGGRGRMWLHVRPDGTPSVVLADNAGRGRIWLASYGDRTSGLLMADGQGRGRAWLGTNVAGPSGLVLIDENGLVQFRAP
jgi:hypothetical protein